MSNLPVNIKDRIISILSNENTVKQAILFGSRARGESKDNSDIDLALVGNDIPLSLNTKLRDIVGLYQLDIVRMDSLEDGVLKDNIVKDGITIYRLDSSIESQE